MKIREYLLSFCKSQKRKITAKCYLWEKWSLLAVGKIFRDSGKKGGGKARRKIKVLTPLGVFESFQSPLNNLHAQKILSSVQSRLYCCSITLLTLAAWEKFFGWLELKDLKCLKYHGKQFWSSQTLSFLKSKVPTKTIKKFWNPKNHMAINLGITRSTLPLFRFFAA